MTIEGYLLAIELRSCCSCIIYSFTGNKESSPVWNRGVVPRGVAIVLLLLGIIMYYLF